MIASLTMGSVCSLVLAMALPGGALAADEPLAAYQWKARVLVAVAPTHDDAKLARQRDIYAAMKAGAGERDLVLVEAVDPSPTAKALRSAFDLGGGFQAVLVGKDGGRKLVSSDPLGPAQLFPVIDAMPMRREEMRKP